MNDKKICFIICSNNEMPLGECTAYINRLIVPENFEIDLLVITEANSMTAGYNEGMKATDAKYKIYMHQDVYIINRNFLNDILKIFDSDSQIGAIGMVGYKNLGDSGCMWLNARCGIHNAYGSSNKEYANSTIDEACLSNEDIITNVLVTDGLLIATSADIEWDEDFDGWDFYDASQGVRFNMEGYRVVVPKQRLPWFIHDDGKYLSMWNYNKYRKFFLEKYGNRLPELERTISLREDKPLVD